MASELLDIPTALSRTGTVNVVGIVVDVFAGVYKSAGSPCITFTLKSSDLTNGHVWDGLKVKYFKSNESHLPPVREGDVILLRKIWIRKYNGKPLAVAADNADIPWAIFRSDPDPMVTNAPMSGPNPFEPTYSEARRCQSLLQMSSGITKFRGASNMSHWSQPNSSQASTSRQTSRPQRELRLIKDLREGTLVDLMGEVVKIYPQSSEKMLLYLSDYTTNNRLPERTSDDGDNRLGSDSFYYRSRKKWTGPSGRMSLPVTLWPPHAEFIQQCVTENNIVYLSYVHIKLNRSNGTMEAVMHEARFNNVHILDPEKDSRAEELVRRSQQYWGNNGKKRKAEEEPKPAKKARAKNKPEPKKEESQLMHELKGRNKPNEHVRTCNAGVRPRSIADIITNESHNNVSHSGISYRLPFQNLCYAATVRVVDFFPPRLKDFAVPQDFKDNDSDVGMSRNGDFTRWEWRFCLLVEDALPPPPGHSRERMKLYVAGGEAEYLLRLDATDLRKDKQALANLRERLFILWGDLEEQKSKAEEMGGLGPRKPARASSRPFNCSIKEYGVKCSHLSNADDLSDDTSGCNQDDCFGWERRFGILLTSIDE
ncbi:hypothetical protein BDV25DRAFT_143789 [Aspergillus avenaceus]|uniref:Protection of telomeres protein 1 n=1 Tax=Aspergillus avenaceus TaxID=36643 RepID=A0A5N6TJT1_ASPAV|nr:hypothetical protein BDV25DRAFT_143789 [Aspergillus avenaceus]